MMAKRHTTNGSMISRRTLTQGILATAVVVGVGRGGGEVLAQSRPRFRPLTSGKPNVASTPFSNPPHIRAASDGSYTLNIQERIAIVGGQQIRLQTYTDANNPNDNGAPGSPLNRPP